MKCLELQRGQVEERKIDKKIIKKRKIGLRKCNIISIPAEVSNK